MRRLLLILSTLGAVGCIHVRDPSAEREEAEEKREAEAVRREAVRKENRQREADSTAAIRAHHAAMGVQHEAAKQQARTNREEALRQECDATREARERDKARVAAAIAQRDELRTWEGGHCRYVDRSLPAARRVQDERGEWHIVEGMSEGVRRECDAPLPKGLEHIYASDIFVPQPTHDIRCQD